MTHPRRTFRHLESTTITASECVDCGAPTYVCLVDGLTARIDRGALADPAAELTALIDGRDTFQLTLGRLLIARDADQITSRPDAAPIHRQHRCPPKPRQAALFDARGMR